MAFSSEQLASEVEGICALCPRDESGRVSLLCAVELLVSKYQADDWKDLIISQLNSDDLIGPVTPERLQLILIETFRNLISAENDTWPSESDNGELQGANVTFTKQFDFSLLHTSTPNPSYDTVPRRRIHTIEEESIIEGDSHFQIVGSPEREELALLKDEVKALKSANQNLKASVTFVESLLVSPNNEIEKLKREIARYQEKLESKEKEHKNAIEKMREQHQLYFTKEILKLSQELAKSQQENCRLMSENTSHTKISEDSESSLTELRKELALKTEEHTRALNRNVQLEKELLDLEGAYNTNNIELVASHDRECTDLLTRLSQLASDNQELQREIRELTAMRDVRNFMLVADDAMPEVLEISPLPLRGENHLTPLSAELEAVNFQMSCSSDVSTTAEGDLRPLGSSAGCQTEPSWRPLISTAGCQTEPSWRPQISSAGCQTEPSWRPLVSTAGCQTEPSWRPLVSTAGCQTEPSWRPLVSTAGCQTEPSWRSFVSTNVGTSVWELPTLKLTMLAAAKRRSQHLCSRRA